MLVRLHLHLRPGRIDTVTACEEKTAAVLADEKPLPASTLAVPTDELPPSVHAEPILSKTKTNLGLGGGMGLGEEAPGAGAAGTTYE